MMKQQWMDMSAYGMKLLLVKTPSTKHYLVLAGGDEDVSQYAAAAATLRFAPHSGNNKILARVANLRPDGVLQDAIVTPEFRRAFPEAVQVDYDPDIHFADKSVPGQDAGRAGPAGLKGVPVGVNRLGHEVFENEAGRYVKGDRGLITLESEASPPNPGLYLRAVDAGSLAASAEGLVVQASRGKILRAEDFTRFLRVVHGEDVPEGDPRIDAARSAVEAASARWLTRSGGKTLRAAFVAAGKMTDNLAFLGDGRGPSPMGVPAPMAVAAQRMLGLEVELKDQTIVVANPGNGAVLSHLPRSSNIKVYESSPVANAAVHGLIDGAGIRSAVLKAETPDFWRSKAIVADFPRRVVEGEAEAEGIAFARRDFAQVLNALRQRDSEGSGVFFLQSPAGEDEAEELKRLREYLSDNYEFEAEAHVDGGLWRGRHDEPDRIMLCVGRRRPEPLTDMLPPPIRGIHDWANLWTLTSEVVVSRTRGQADEKAEVELNEGDASLARNTYQTPYVSASRIGTPTTMVPRNLEGATKEALARVSRLYGDIDDFVAKEFFYDRKSLAEIFSPEQVDALALYLHAEKRGRGFLIADQTGVGKGRFLAAVMRRAALTKRKVLFMTEREQNFSDIQRDIVSTRSGEEFSTMVLNNGAKLIDHRTKQVVMNGAPREQVDAMLASGAWPEGVNLMMATYSQFTRATGADAIKHDGDGRDATAKSRWLVDAVDENTIVLLDESHNASSGSSNVSRNFVQVVGKCGGVVYSSATFAKDAQNMAFYAPLFPNNLSASELSVMMAKGGETFQEVLAGMLVHDGVMIRREFDLSRVEFETVLDTQRFERNRGLMDSIAPVLAEMAALSGEMDQRIAALNDPARARQLAAEERAAAIAAREGAADAPALPAPAGEEGRGRGRRRQNNVKPFQISRTGFGSPLYTLSRLFVAAIKVDACAEQAIFALQNGQKPVILVENTMQQLLEELAESSESMEGTLVVDFRALFHRTLKQMLTTSHVDAKGVTHRRDISEADPALGAANARIKRMIDNLPSLPVSVIDEVKSRIRASGFTIDEITGRSLEVVDGKVMRRPAQSSTVIKNAFNDGELDALIINVAGSTGIDLHAGSTFKDQRQRLMIKLQPPADPVREVQADGRVNRYDQVSDPKVMSIISGLPIEMRLAAMQNAKLRKMSANTTSNRDAANLMRDIPDLINPIGDVVCSRYAEARPELMRRLGFKVGDVENAAEANMAADAEQGQALRRALAVPGGGLAGGAKDESFRVTDTKRTASEILARLIMLPVALQEKVCNELTAEFHAAVEELEARGETPLRTNDLPGIVHPREQTIFDGAEVENPDSVFDEPLYALTAALERVGAPIKGDDLLQRIELGELASGRSQPCIDRIVNDRDEILEPYLPLGVPTVEDALVRGTPSVVRRKEMLERLVAALEELRPGKQLRYTVDGEEVLGIVTRIDYAPRGMEHVPGLYGVEFVVAGDERPRSMRLETLLKDPAFFADGKLTIRPGLSGEAYDTILRDFDNAVLNKLSTVVILNNNLFRAMRMNVELGLGRLQNYRLNDGTLYRGVVLAARHRDMRAVPVELGTPAMAYDAVVGEGIEGIGSSGLDDKVFSVRKTESAVEMRLPGRNSRKYGYIYDHPRILGLLNRTEDAKSGHKVTLSREEFREILPAIHEVGARFWCSPAKRKWASQWLLENSAAAIEDRAGEQPRLAAMGA